MVERYAWSERQERADEEKVIPWAQGNGLWAILERIAADLSSVDVVTFFAQNPFAFDSALSISERIGRRLEAVAPTLESLVLAGFVDRLDIEGVVIYQMTSDPHHQQTLQQYVAWVREAYHWARLAMLD